MASNKNRSRNANRRSPKPVDRLQLLRIWVLAHRRHAIIGGLAFLIIASPLAGYWLAERFGTKPPPEPKYARIEDIPDLPQYSEAEPGQPSAVLEEKPRPAPIPTPNVAPNVATAAAPEATWRKNAVPFRDLRSKPLVAIVIDDVGLDRPRSKRAWELPGPLTMSFLPYAKDLREQARAARARGHELMLHLPMEPSGRNDPGPNALRVSMSESDVRQRVTMALDSFEGAAGLNNHMGSRFTAQRPGMETVLRVLKARGLMFLDSRTTAQSVGDGMAHELGVPGIVRHVFLDDDESLGAVRAKLADVERLARAQGFVVAIGHPHEATLQALAEWLPGVAGKGLALAPATAVLRKRNGWD